MRHPHYLPPNVQTMGILLPPEPLQRTCAELGVCQGDGRCHGCAPVEPADSTGGKPGALAQFAHAILVVALSGVSTGIAIGALYYLAELLA